MLLPALLVQHLLHLIHIPKTLWIPMGFSAFWVTVLLVLLVRTRAPLRKKVEDYAREQAEAAKDQPMSYREIWVVAMPQLASQSNQINDAIAWYSNYHANLLLIAGEVETKDGTRFTLAQMQRMRSQFVSGNIKGAKCIMSDGKVGPRVQRRESPVIPDGAYVKLWIPAPEYGSADWYKYG